MTVAGMQSAGDDMVEVQRYVRALESLLGVTASRGNRVDRFRNGDEIFPAMLDAIRAAERSVDLLTFVYWTGDIATEFAAALCERARAGVRVRVILDTFGARFMERDLVESLEEAGVAIHWFRPPTNMDNLTDLGNRTHRKLLIVDEVVGFTGGVGIAGEWEGDARDPAEWRDTHFRVEGPAVDGLRAGFADDWVESDGVLFDDADEFPEHRQVGDQVAVTVKGEAESGWSDIATLKRALCDLARERINITTAYFSPDEDMTRWLIEAARRGVAIRVLTPGDHIDKRLPQVAGESHFPELLEAGIEIHRYNKTMLHAKVMTVDGVVADVGSSNFNNRSLQHDEEIDLVVFDPGFVEVLDADMEEDLRHAERISLDDWEERSAMQRAQEAVVEVIDRFV